jgi:hypothetical protein
MSQLPGVAQDLEWVGLGLEQGLDAAKGVSEYIPESGQGPEEVAQHGELAALGLSKEQGWSTGLEDSALDLTHFQVRVYRGLYPAQLTASL